MNDSPTIPAKATARTETPPRAVVAALATRTAASVDWTASVGNRYLPYCADANHKMVATTQLTATNPNRRSLVINAPTTPSAPSRGNTPSAPSGISPNLLDCVTKRRGDSRRSTGPVPRPNVPKLKFSFTGSHCGLRNTALRKGKTGLPVKTNDRMYQGAARVSP